ncbi:MAG TPA: ubiquinol-cytochrome c reductase iron-sulfur subunit [Gemmataceae bacterium]|nr:ubiquinol-cytochrome c reductase iron-sulfur subunit [Gemmataceae bacterium]
MSDPNTNSPENSSPPPDKPETGVTPNPTPAAPPTAAVTAKPAAPAAPKPAAKPVAKGKPGRRGFLYAMFGTWIGWAWTTMTASFGLMTLGTVRFLYPNVLAEPPSRIKIGTPDTYEDGKVEERYKEKHAWIVRRKDEKLGDIIYALSTTCTHLGCTPNWLEREQKFKCPCHGSGFYISGINFEGPAPRPLERWAISIGDDGQMVVDMSKKFQQERGEWSNPESFIKV